MDGSEYGSGLIPQRGIPTASPQMVPYGATGSGHAGNGSSRDRQEREDALGTTAFRQRQCLEAVTAARSEGVTVMEIEEKFNLHHGQSSSALSHLHRAGYIRRLKMRRGGQELYVLPDHINGRDESPYRPRGGRKHPKFTTDEEVLKSMTAAGLPPSPENLNVIRKVLEFLP